MNNRQKILVVDDTPENIDVLVGCLKDLYRVQAARSGEAALKIASSAKPPDLILLDIMMPGMDGYEVCQRLMANPDTRSIPVIFVTALSEAGDETRGLEAGAVDYITKPISPPIVRARIKTHLALRRSMTDLQQAYDLIEAQKRRMQSELDVGHEIQMSMLPTGFPERPEIDVHAWIAPAREVGGDFYDCFMLDADRLCICVGDVSDKGVPSALLMAVTKTIIRVRAATDSSPGAILDYVQQELSRDNDACMFVTIFLAVLDLRTGELTSSNAGHNPPLLRKTDGKIERLTRRDGSMVGAPIAAPPYTQGKLRLQPGETLLLYSDGVTEAEDASEALFGMRRLEDVLSGNPADGMRALVTQVVDAARAFEAGRPASDDVCVLALRFNGGIDTAPPSFRISIPNDGAQIPAVNAGFQTFAEDQGIPEAVQDKIQMAIDELLSNVIGYAYDDEEVHTIDIAVTLLPDRLELVVSDDGQPFDPFAVPPADTGLPVTERIPGGLGIHLLHRIFDQTEYRRQGAHNLVSVQIRLDRAKQS